MRRDERTAELIRSVSTWSGGACVSSVHATLWTTSRGSSRQSSTPSSSRATSVPTGAPCVSLARSPSEPVRPLSLPRIDLWDKEASPPQMALRSYVWDTPPSSPAPRYLIRASTSLCPASTSFEIVTVQHTCTIHITLLIDVGAPSERAHFSLVSRQAEVGPPTANPLSQIGARTYRLLRAEPKLTAAVVNVELTPLCSGKIRPGPPRYRASTVLLDYRTNLLQRRCQSLDLFQ